MVKTQACKFGETEKEVNSMTPERPPKEILDIIRELFGW